MMFTDCKTVVNALFVVLFLTMIVLDFTLFNMCFFIVLFYLMWNLR